MDISYVITKIALKKMIWIMDKGEDYWGLNLFHSPIQSRALDG